MSSHREAPEISKDPVADSTDLYAFVSTNEAAAGTVTLIANYIPLEPPAGGPNFYEFGEDVLYEINIDNDTDSEPEIKYQFRFQTVVGNPNTFLYNTGQITSLSSSSWNRKQFYSVTRVDNGKPIVLATNVPCPPVNIGPRSTPNYTTLAQAAVHTLPTGEKVFAGQRLEGFYVDLGSIFDLGTLRPFASAHLINMPPSGPGVDSTKAVNVHTISIQVPMNLLTKDGSTPTDPSSPISVIGVWTAAYRQKTSIHEAGGKTTSVGPWVQVSRLGNPLFNEVIVPMGKKDDWNSLAPDKDSLFLQYVQHPELAGLLPILYPGVFPNLAGLTAARSDLVAILLTGIPPGIINGFQNFTGNKYADMLRLNMAIPPSSSPNRNGLIGGDLAGFPNGRRVFDDVATVEIRAIAGITYPLVNPGYTPDAAAGAVTDFQTSQFGNGPGQVPGQGRYISNFPYLGVPKDGYDVPAPQITC